MRAEEGAKPGIKTARAISAPSPQKIKAIENTRLRREEMDMLALEQYYLDKFGKDIGGWRRSTPEKYLAQEDIANAPTTIAGGFHQSANPLHSIPITKYYAGLRLPIRAPKLLSRNYRQPSRGYQTTPSIDQRVGSNQNKIYDSTRHKVGKKMRQYPNNIHGATVGVGAVPGITSSNDYLQNTSVNDSNTIQSIVNQMRGANGYTTSLPIFMMTYPLTQSAQYALEDDEEYLRLRPKDESKDLTALRSSNYLKRPRDALPISQLPFDWLETSKDESRNDNSSEVIRDSKRLNIRVGQVQPKVISKPMVRSDVMSAIAKDIRQDTRQDVLQGIDVSQSIRSTQDIMQNVRQETRQKLREDTKLKSQPTLRSKPIRRGERIIRIRQQPKVVKFKVPGLLELPDGQKMKKSRGKSSIKTTRTVWDIASPDAAYFGGIKRKKRGDDLITVPIKQIGITNIKLPVTKLKI